MAKKIKQKVRCSTYNQIKEFNSIEEAKKFFLDCMLGSEGAEQSRYVQVYGQLEQGHTYCTDNERVTEQDLLQIEEYFKNKDLQGVK